jgi:hypothetical protein
MEKKDRYLSFELVFALLFIIAFFLPWLDKYGVKVVGWDIPDLQKKIIRVSNFFKFFSKNKDWIYSTHVVYLVPFLSVAVIGFRLMLKKRTARFFLLMTGIFAFVVSLNLFYKLPGAGSGVYLLCGTSVLSIIYLIVSRRKKEEQTELVP